MFFRFLMGVLCSAPLWILIIVMGVCLDPYMALCLGIGGLVIAIALVVIMDKIERKKEKRERKKEKG